MKRFLHAVVLCSALGPCARGSAQEPSAKDLLPGLKVTYAPLAPDQRKDEGAHAYRVRLLALSVERGETPTPLISPGLFEADFEGILPLLVRDRYRFRVEGRGSFALAINGEQVLRGTLRTGRAEETQQPVRLQKGENKVTLHLESSGTGEAQVRLSWSNSEFAFEPIGADLWRWPADDAQIAAGERLRRGQQVFVERRCANCHLPVQPAASPFGEFSLRGPDLRDVGARLRAPFFAEWLRDPRAVRPDATMPRFPIGDGEIEDLAAWLATLGKPLPDDAAAAGARERGAVRFLELGCIACHVPPDAAAKKPDPHGRIALGHVARKWQPVALQQFLLNPLQQHPDTRMPDVRLELADAAALTAYLIGGGAPGGTAPRGDVDAGRRIATRLRCDRCHEVSLPETGLQFQELRALHPDHGCLASTPSNARADAPDHGLTDVDLAAVRAFLPFADQALRQRAPMDYAARMLPALRCTNCHGMDGRASVWAQVAVELSATAPLPKEQDPVAQGVPALTWVGSKLQPGWMERFVVGDEPSPRPWLTARMPKFSKVGPAVVGGLVRSHGYAAADEAAGAPDAQLALHGARLVKVGEGFGCVQCHAVGKTPATQVFEREGINFAVAAVRLRHDYYMRWLLDPPRIDPDSRMPKFADAKGKTAFGDVLGGDAAKQFEAIWNWFRTLK